MMETFTRIIVDLGPGLVVVILFAILLAAMVFAGFVLRERKKLRNALDTVRVDLSRTQALNDRLADQIRVLASQVHGQKDYQDTRADMTAGHTTAFAAPISGGFGEKTVLFRPSDNESETYAGMPYLKVTAGKDEGTLHYLQFSRNTIGRDRSNTLPIKDSNSSRWHCETVFRNHHFVLTDNNSTNGIFCNGERIQECRLDFGDRITIGDTEMVFSCEGFDLKDSDPAEAVRSFEKCLQQQPDFLLALKHLAFLMERDITRQKEAQPLWDRIRKLEGSEAGKLKKDETPSRLS
jgi:Flp pilus assembly protein TadG